MTELPDATFPVADPDCVAALCRRVASGETTAADAAHLAQLLPVWIAVDAALPPIYTDVLLCIDGEADAPSPEVDLGHRLPDGSWRYSDMSDLEIRPAPTHWMALPLPPLAPEAVH